MKTFMFGVCIAACLLVVAAVHGPGVYARDAIAAELSLLPAFKAANADCATCGNCLDPEKHHLEDGEDDPDRRYLEPFHGCLESWSDGKCADRHPESAYCTGGGIEEDSLAVQLTLADVKERVWNVATGNQRSGAGIALRSLGRAVTYNAERQALQVVACDGSIAMSAPVSPELARTLTL